MEDAVKANPDDPNAADDPFDLARHVQWVEDWEEVTTNARKLSERDRDYYDNKQLTTEELKELNDRGQPDVIFNLIQPKIDYLLGFEATTRTDPRAYPRTPQDEDASEAATDALRFVEDETELQQKHSLVWEYLLIEGYGGIELVLTDEASGEFDAVEWEWDRLFYDPHSRKHDFSDGRYLGGVVWMDTEEAKITYPSAQQQEAIETTVSDDGSALNDRPKWKQWVSGGKRKRVKIVQMYYKNGVDWYWCHFTRGGKLEGGPVPFRDQKGRSWCPMFLQSAYVDRNNNRYGMVRVMISPQDETNKRRSKSLHLLTQRQTKAEKGAVDDVDEMKAEMARSDGHVEYNPGFNFEVIDTSAQAQGNMELMQQAIQHIQQVGPNAALLGKQQGDLSGRAILANQQSGQTEINRLMDRHRHLKKRVYQGIWNLVRQYKTAEWWVRVTDDEKNVKFVGFNKPVTFREAAAKKLQKQGAQPEQIAQFLQSIESDPVRAPLLDQQVGVENVPAEMNMDITIEEVPDVANVQAEQFETLTKMAPAVVFPPEVYIQASSLRNKRELIEKLKSEQESPEAQALKKALADQAFRKTEAEIKKLEADAMKSLAQADQANAQSTSLIEPTVVSPGGAKPPNGAAPPPSPQQIDHPNPSPAPQPGF